jgi:hypothetical protein
LSGIHIERISSKIDCFEICLTAILLIDFLLPIINKIYEWTAGADIIKSLLVTLNVPERSICAEISDTCLSGYSTMDLVD